MQIRMTANQRVSQHREVDMSEQDYSRYLELCESDLSSSEIDRELSEIASRYGLDDGHHDSYDDEMEDIEFTKV